MRVGRSIHPQGWVPIETVTHRTRIYNPLAQVAFTPKGGCPLKPSAAADGRWGLKYG